MCHRPICEECAQTVVRGKIKNNSRRGIIYCPVCLKSKLAEERDRASLVQKKVRRELKIAAIGVIVGLAFGTIYELYAINAYNDPLTLPAIFFLTYLPLMPAAGIWYYRFMGKTVEKYFKTLGCCFGALFLMALLFILAVLVFILPFVGAFRIAIRLVDRWRLKKIINRDEKQIEYLNVLVMDMIFTECGPIVPSGTLGSNCDMEINTAGTTYRGGGSVHLDNGEVIFRAERR
jgi:hypothetical protein